ncbi:MAG: RidA family protein [Planctomycetaceae bacterium]
MGAEKLEVFRLNQDSPGADAVVVHDQALIHSGMILPTDEEGHVTADTFAAQLSQLGNNLEQLIKSTGSDLQDVVSLRYYVSEAKHLELMRTFKLNGNVAITLAVTPLPDSAAQVGAEVVFCSEKTYHQVYCLPSPIKGARLTVLPRGRAVYISGQLEKGEGTIETARLTMEGLHKTLEHIGLDDSHVVYIRTFVDPISKVDEVDEVIHSFYPKQARPSVTHVEWKTTDSIEIEMIAYAPEEIEIEGADQAESVQHFWLPWLTISPVYCRWTLINSPDRIYISEQLGMNSDTHEAEIHEIFGRIKEILAGTGSDLNSLAKATYFTTNAEVSKPFGEIRPEYYDPQHPPAASLARIEAIALEGKSIAIDMIAAPVQSGK